MFFIRKCPAFHFKDNTVRYQSAPRSVTAVPEKEVKLTTSRNQVLMSLQVCLAAGAVIFDLPAVPASHCSSIAGRLRAFVLTSCHAADRCRGSAMGFLSDCAANLALWAHGVAFFKVLRVSSDGSSGVFGCSCGHFCAYLPCPHCISRSSQVDSRPLTCRHAADGFRVPPWASWVIGLHIGP